MTTPREVNIQTKKTARQNSQSLLNVAQPSTAAATAAEESLTTEIADIMKGFGDCDHPQPESVRLIENILRDQLCGILQEAMAISNRRRGTNAPILSDFEFLMRNHPVKINRMHKHIKDMRLLRRILNMQAGRAQPLYEEFGSQDSEEESEVPEKFDDERTRRLFRADRISQILNGQQYTNFNEARRTSFYCRHGEKMKQKFRVFLSIPAEIQLTNICQSILAYLAHETIATIVDFAILTRLNSDNRISEPHSRATSAGASFAMLHLCPEVTHGRGLEAVKPITVQEIQEGLRRHAYMSRSRMGFHRNQLDSNPRNKFLAI